MPPAPQGAGIVALVAALATMFKPQWSAPTSLVFAAAKGVALAGFSAFLELKYPGEREEGPPGSKRRRWNG
jgi:hypothetical protein